ncbi:MAG: hypothetical protein ABIW33_04515 [Sphingomicrobium sp.]
MKHSQQTNQHPGEQRADPLSALSDPLEPLELTADQIAPDPYPAQPLDLTADQIALDPYKMQPMEGAAPDVDDRRGAGGRRVLAWTLGIFAAAWIAYTGWAAGKALSSGPMGAPQIAQWLSIAAGPLALLGLAWLTFGRTRRRESERFTRSVISMRHEAQSLEALLEVLSQRIVDSRSELVATTRQLMQLGDDATARFGGITREFDGSSEKLRKHGEALDRAALSARTDVAVLLEDLPRAEQTARLLTEQLRAAGSESGNRTAQLGQQVNDLAQRTRETELLIGEAVDRLAARMFDVESAGASAAVRVGEADASFKNTLETLFDGASASLQEIRSGIDAQSAAVAALVGQASSGLGQAGADAAQALAGHVDHANSALDGLSGRVAEQERASQRMIAEIDRGLVMIDERFTTLASQGDERATHFLESLGRARTELDGLAAQALSQDNALGSLADRTAAIRESLDRLTNDIREEAGVAIGEAQGSADRLAATAAAIRPDITSISDSVAQASDRLDQAASLVDDTKARLTGLVDGVTGSVDATRSKLGELAAVIVEVERETASLTAQTGPALVTALVQVREAAGQAAMRAREAIERVIPDATAKLSAETRDALEQVIRESIDERLREVEGVAARAVDSARAASDRLTQQMLALGQSAAALEAHIEDTDNDRRAQESEAFARRVALLIDSMNSAAIDVGKIMSDEIDDKAWGAYLKGNRGVFTSRAVRLIGGSETRALRAHYETDIEFQRSVNRFVHDFEEMLHRVLNEREGGTIAVTLMSSDMGKLYAALGQAIEKKR